VSGELLDKGLQRAFIGEKMDSNKDQSCQNRKIIINLRQFLFGQLGNFAFS
jgi:hypothetical protein